MRDDTRNTPEVSNPDAANPDAAARAAGWRPFPTEHSVIGWYDTNKYTSPTAAYSAGDYASSAEDVCRTVLDS
ncbi:hypothetical protein CKO28_01340 [Rhodovibrio sodomensis]|uniref:Uncharacterized protein n=1 Tax=Rhodovibrio sodomensis TaxID=1088 RepID=A0ABS1D8D2_9PROT|nr:hypothetical protein [Rhodovibrio sodomensis]MBK1666688.1 hypothetical protein [Rhodovibrio sodomensis]